MSTPSIPTPVRRVRPTRRARWLLLAGLGLAAMALLARCGAGAPAGRTDAALLGPTDLSPDDPAGAARWQAVPPPVDLSQAELVARAAAGGTMAAARARSAVTWRDPQAGSEVTQAVLRYDDGAAASEVVSAAAPLLERTFGLVRAPADLAGTSEATAWHSALYSGMSFRLDDTLVFVGGSNLEPARLNALAAAARDRLVLSRQTQAAAATPSP